MLILSFVLSLRITRFGVSAVSAGILRPVIAKLEPTCVQTYPLNSYVRSVSLFESMKAIRSDVNLASPIEEIDAIDSPVPTCVQVEPLNW